MRLHLQVLKIHTQSKLHSVEIEEISYYHNNEKSSYTDLLEGFRATQAHSRSSYLELENYFP